MWPPLNLREYINIVLPGLLLTFLTAYGLDVFFQIQVLRILDSAGLSVAFYFVTGLVGGFIIDSSDLILYSRIPLKEIEFFRKHMPSLYLVKRCSTCNSVVCLNRLVKAKSDGHPTEHRPNHVDLWFYIFNNIISDYLRSYTLSVSSACRGILYLKYVSLFFLVMSSALLATVKFSTVIYSIRDIHFVFMEKGIFLAALCVAIIVYLLLRDKKDRSVYYFSRACLVFAGLMFSYFWLRLGKLLFSGPEFIYMFVCWFLCWLVTLTVPTKKLQEEFGLNGKTWKIISKLGLN